MSISIRPAHFGETELLPEIEDSAELAFLESDQSAAAMMPARPVEFLRPLVVKGLVWVAVDTRGPIGFACTEVFDDALHLWELAVRHDAQRRGAGRALVAAVIVDAGTRNAPAVTLTTFSNVPWNAPFYERLGFETLADAALPPRLAAIRAEEDAVGLTDRCAMRLVL
jgi:ribosomal protein S18 acetylase RimI-like enzyme